MDRNMGFRRVVRALRKQAEQDAESVRLTGLLSAEPTEEQVHGACLSFRHDYGLLDKADREKLQYEAKEWLRCWAKAFGA